MLYGTLGVLTSVATHYPGLDFMAAYRGYADGWSDEEIHVLGESLMSPARLVAEQVTLQWVMNAHRSRVARSVHPADVIQPAEVAEVAAVPSDLPFIAEPSAVASTVAELPPSLPTASSANPTMDPQ